MADRRGRDQFAVRWGDETEIFWNDAARGLAEQARECTLKWLQQAYVALAPGFRAPGAAHECVLRPDSMP